MAAYTKMAKWSKYFFLNIHNYHDKTDKEDIVVPNKKIPGTRFIKLMARRTLMYPKALKPCGIRQLNI